MLFYVILFYFITGYLRNFATIFSLTIYRVSQKIAPFYFCNIFYQTSAYSEHFNTLILQ